MKIQREIFFLVMTKRNGSFYFSKMHEIHFSPLFLVRILKKKKKKKDIEFSRKRNYYLENSISEIYRPTRNDLIITSS